jgi:WD40 repeat protein/uncharacterized caspase-like protein
MRKISLHRIAESVERPLTVFLILLLATTMLRAQNPAPTPTDKRDLGLQPTQQPGSQTTQIKAKEAKPELVLQTGYNNFFAATRLAFSPDGRLLATATVHTNTIKLWESATGRELRNLSAGGQHTFSLAPAFAFSPDSRLLAAAGENNSINIWEVSTGREVQTLNGGQASTFMTAIGVSFVAFSADGKKLVTISDAVRVWDTSSWKETVTLKMSEIDPSGLTGGVGGALSADGNQLARVNGDKIQFIDLVSGRQTRTIDLPDNRMDSAELAFAADGHLLVAGINEKKLKVWDVTSKAERVQAPTQREFSIIKFSADGRFIALCENYTIKIWEVATGRALPPLNVPNTGVFVEYGGVFANFSQDGKKLATSGFGTQTFVWETETGKQLQQMKGRTNMAYAVAFSADGTQLTSGGRTRWDLRTGQGRRLSSQPSDKLFAMPSSDGKLVAMFAPNVSTITIYDTNNGKVLQTLTRANSTEGVEKVYFSPDGRSLAVSYMQAKGTQMIGRLPSSQLIIWDVSAGREIQTLTLSAAPATAGFSADGQVLATVVRQGEISLWEVASGKRLQALTSAAGQTDPLANLGGMIPKPGNIKRGQIPNMSNMPNMADISAMMSNVLGSLAAGTNGRTVTSLSFSQDGKILASGGVESKSNFDLAARMGQAQANQKRPKNQPTPDPNNIMNDLKIETTGQIVLWNPATGQQIGTIKGHGKGVNAVVLSRDAKLIASAGTDNSIKIWDVATQRELKTLTGHIASIDSMDFSPDGKLLASASDDGSTFLWDTTTGEHLLTLISLDDGGEWMVVTPEGLFDGTPQSWNQILWRYNQDTFNVAPVEWFFNEYYYPGLLSEVFAGKRPRVAQDISIKDRRQPIVKLSVGGATENISTRTVKVKIDIADALADADHPKGTGARDVRLFRNGSLVKVWHGDALKGQTTVALEEEISVIAGPNRLTAYAFNSDNVKSKDANLVLTGADSLKRAGTAWVIAVGVNEYANSQYNLKYAVADANSFAEEVQRQQQQLARFQNIEIVPLLNDQATKANILTALRRLSGATEAPTLKAGPLDRLKRAEPEDAVVIYFAGHGTAQGQRFYLLPHDLGYTGERGALDESGLKTILSHSISDEELEDAVEGLAAGSLLMVIDACNSGQALEAEEKRRGPMNSKGLAQLAYEKGMYILTAAQSYQAALEAAQLGHGLLTYALVEEGLKSGVADNEPKDGVVNAREWLDFATERVPQMQEEKMKESRGLGLNIAFTEGEQKIADPEKRSVQRPRVFYRREMETSPLVVAKPGAPPK